MKYVLLPVPLLTWPFPLDFNPGSILIPVRLQYHSDNEILHLWRREESEVAGCRNIIVYI